MEYRQVRLVLQTPVVVVVLDQRVTLTQLWPQVSMAFTSAPQVAMVVLALQYVHSLRMCLLCLKLRKAVFLTSPRPA
jgi:hypothetical protein